MNEENKGNYVLGIIGGFIGGLVAAIPWVLAYVFGNIMIAILAIFIAMGVNTGYKLFKGKRDEKLPIIITVTSLLIVTLVTLVIIPIAIMFREGVIVSIEHVQAIYNSSSFKEAIIRDLVISVIFTFIGISGVVNKVKSEVAGEVIKPQAQTEPVISENSDALKAATVDIYGGTGALNVEGIKKYFVDKNALDKRNAVSKEELSEIFADKNLKRQFNLLRTQTIIKKKKGKFYYSEKAEKSVLYRMGTLYVKLFSWMIIVFAVSIIIIAIASQ